MIRKFRWIYLAIVCTYFLTACSGASNPKMLASYTNATPIAAFPGQSPVVYDAYIELVVPDIDIAAQRAAQKTYDYGGYLESSQSWYVDGRKNTTLVLAVPAANFDLLRQTLLSLGTLVNERVSVERVKPRYPEPQYSTITLQLRPSGFTLPRVTMSGWHPWQTLQKASGVFLSIFGFLVDILIWIIVVAGPFALLGWLGWWFVKRVSRPSPPTDKEN